MVMQSFMPHEVLMFSPDTLLRHPQGGIKSREYLVSLFLIRGGILTYLFSYLGGYFVGTVIVCRRVGNSTAIVIEGIARPDTAICVIQTIVVRVVVAFLPCEMQSDGCPHLAGIVQVAGSFDMPKQLVHVA